jgi:hypothetical protein
MTAEEFQNSLTSSAPPPGIDVLLEALWWDAKGEWAKAHGLVDELETPDGMAVHAYLHRKEGAESNAEYWYQRAGRRFYRPKLEEEWSVLVEGMIKAGT